MGGKTKIRQTPRKPSTFRKEDFVQKSTPRNEGKSTSGPKKSSGKGGVKGVRPGDNFNPKTVLVVKKRK